MSKLRLAGITRKYGSFTAVDNIDLEVSDGEFVTLLGPSGCGKTTTLRMVAGFIAPDSGEIWFDNRRMTDVPPHRRNTAMVFQSYALFPHMSVAENVAFGLKMRNLPAAEQAKRIDEALDMVSLRGLEARRPGQLSGGQQQRVALARAIVTRPDILLFDEPLSNLDAKLREKVRLEIRELQRRLDITTLYVTHDQAEALAISDRIVVMNGGHIEQIGDPSTIYRAPRSAFVADFLGAANIVAGDALGGGVVDSRVGRFAIADASPSLSGHVTVSWRPEDMKVAMDGSANIRDAVVRSIVFRGNFVELLVEVAGHPLRAQLDSDLSVSEGDVLSFTVPAHRIRVVE
ncbi:MAG TPA: ABC transporter ATP-binding protein [Dongiaceae bacterium]|jgi:ABC-type Fe3+/spermidine/putrescine transport system ATPase subunit|nr:ABC transporter ATP-binding protein [Dongiaceae bacterium]